MDFWFFEIVQEERPSTADYVASFARNTDVLEKKLKECDDVLQEANLGI